MTRISMAALAAVLVAAATTQAQAADPSPSDVVNHHMSVVNTGDMDALMSDYADDAVVLQAGTAVQGKATITTTLTRLFGPDAPKMNIVPVKVWQEGDVGFVDWTANGGALKGQDSFLVKNGKIEVQAVWIGGPAPAGPAPAK
jgi:ketosteroid isomerase-like protein